MNSISCPKCGSHDWKSAKLIVLEGTTQTVGDIGGRGSTPSTFSGGLKNFLLADAWFSRDFPLQFDVGLTTTTALVEEIKAFMTAQAVTIPEPVEPTSPENLSFWAKIAPVKGKAKKEKISKKPEPPSKPLAPKMQKPPFDLDKNVSVASTAKGIFFNQLLLVSLAFIISGFIFVKYIMEFFEGGYMYSIKSFEDFYGLPNVVSAYVDNVHLYIVCVFLIAILCFPLAIIIKPVNERYRAEEKEREKTRKAKFDKEYSQYQDDLKSHEKTVNQFNETTLRDYEIELEAIKEREINEEKRLEYEYQKALLDHREKLEHEEAQKRNYDRKMEDYVVAYRHYENQRLALWERAAVCMRCGLAFSKSEG